VIRITIEIAGGVPTVAVAPVGTGRVEGAEALLPVAERRPAAPPADPDGEEAFLRARSASGAATAAADALRLQGMEAWGRLVETWARNFGVAEAPQPDRVAALMAICSGYGRAISAYARSCGGLCGATIDALLARSVVPPEEAGLLGRKIALNAVQVASTQGVPLERLMEASILRNVFGDVSPEERDAALAAVPLEGGVAADSLDFDKYPGVGAFEALAR
jgi:hypothetical protein